jgi:type I restriction enzyme M protein
MSEENNASSVISKVWGFASMLRDDGVGYGDYLEQLTYLLFLKMVDEYNRPPYSRNIPIPPEYNWESLKDKNGAELEVHYSELLRVLSTTKGTLGQIFTKSQNKIQDPAKLYKLIDMVDKQNWSMFGSDVKGKIYEGLLEKNAEDTKSGAGQYFTPRALIQAMVECVRPKPSKSIIDPACGTGGYLTCAIEHLKAQANSIEDRKSIAENVMGWEYKPLPYLLATTNLILHDMEVPNIRFGDALDQPLSNFTEKHRVNAILANPPFGGIVANNNENNFPQNFRTKESADLFLILMIHLLKQGGRAGIVLPDGSLTGDGVKQRVRQKLLEECNLHTIIRLPNSVFQPYATVATNLLFFTKGTPTKEVWYYEHRLPEGQKAYNKTKPIQAKEFNPIKKWWNDRKESDIAWKVDIQTIIDRNYDLDIKNPTKQEEVHEFSSTELMELLHTSFAKSNALLNQLKEAVN